MKKTGHQTTKHDLYCMCMYIYTYVDVGVFKYSFIKEIHQDCKSKGDFNFFIP